MMKRLIIMIFASVCLTVAARGTYETTALKAARFFEAREWASAQALYGLMLDERPDADSIYVNAIVASGMLGDSIASSHFLSTAMGAGLSFDKLMGGIRSVSFEVGAPEVYEDFLLRSQRDCPWLSRAIDSELLDYYLFRDNGQQSIVYARKMLAGLPDSRLYLGKLAQGYVLAADYASAVKLWQEMLALDPDDYDTLIDIGNYMAITGEHKIAEEYLAHAYSLHPTPYVASVIASLAAERKNK